MSLTCLIKGQANKTDMFKCEKNQCFVIIIMIPIEEAVFIEVSWGKKIHKASHHQTQN